MRKYIIEEKAFAENALQGDFGRRQRRNKMSFSENLKKLRKSYEISQKAFARELNVSQSTVASWETGAREPSIETLLSLSAFFNVSVDYLLSGRLRENVSDNEKNAYGAKKKNAAGGAKRVLEIYKKLSKTDKNRLESFAEQLEKLEAAEKL